MKVSSSATVRTSLDTAWRVLADHEGMAQWGPGIKVTIEKPGAPERGGVGAVRRISAPGPAPAIVEEITAFDAPSRLGYKALGGVPFADYSGEVTLVASQAGVEITWTLEARQRVPFVEQGALKAVSVALLNAYVRALKKTA